MSGHVVGTFGVVFIIRRVFGYHGVEMAFKISTNRWIGIFVQRQARRGVFDENLNLAGPDIADLG